MYNFLFFCLCFCFFTLANAQLVINELDSDTPGVDDKEFIEIKSATPNFTISNRVLVLFNGSSSGGNTSYYALDLDGLTTDANGLLLVGNQLVSPVPDVIVPNNTVQNGVDAAAIYIGSESDFPDGTLATTTNLVDALVYGASSSVSTSLLNLLGQTTQYDENENGNRTTESLQRKPDNSFEAKLPTPFLNNDGSGIVFNGISIVVANTVYDEGDSFDIDIVLDQPAAQNLNISLDLDFENFTTADFTGNTQLSIPINGTQASTTINLIDDGINDGDKFLSMKHMANIPDGFKRLNDNLKIQVNDINYTSDAWGTPVNPSFGMVAPTTPSGYYDAMIGLADDNLKDVMQSIIADDTQVRAHTYTDIIDILKAADQNPENSNEVFLLYTEQPRAKIEFQTGSSNVGKWNREHIYPQSRGGFFPIELDEIATGINQFTASSADSLRHGMTDAHALRAADGPENSSRGNQDFGEYNGPSGNIGAWKGDVARAVFYMAVRYNGLDVVAGNPANTVVGQLGDLNILLQWHQQDPPDDFEMNRNNIIYNWQLNRNPFIDHPELAEHLWGTLVGTVWNPTLSNAGFDVPSIKFFPNPSKGVFNLSHLENLQEIRVYNSLGLEVLNTTEFTEQRLDLSNFKNGIYIVQMLVGTQKITQKLIIAR
ncbi:MAG: endonuclease [Flavobacteriaceae bacterium]|nr:endonuclease [Flavobacteriaceae bacterium]